MSCETSSCALRFVGEDIDSPRVWLESDLLAVEMTDVAVEVEADPTRPKRGCRFDDIRWRENMVVVVVVVVVRGVCVSGRGMRERMMGLNDETATRFGDTLSPVVSSCPLQSTWAMAKSDFRVIGGEVVRTPSSLGGKIGSKGSLSKVHRYCTIY